MARVPMPPIGGFHETPLFSSLSIYSFFIDLLLFQRSNPFLSIYFVTLFIDCSSIKSKVTILSHRNVRKFMEADIVGYKPSARIFQISINVQISRIPSTPPYRLWVKHLKILQILFVSSRVKYKNFSIISASIMLRKYVNCDVIIEIQILWEFSRNMRFTDSIYFHSPMCDLLVLYNVHDLSLKFANLKRFEDLKD